MLTQILACVLVALPPGPAQEFHLPDPSIEDACLNDVQFVDAECGWAVGDQGTIWHTADGGASWRLQPSGTFCSLQSVWFVDRQTGWVAGGQGLPYGSGSRGLVLGTTDGGQSWQSLSWDQFPRFHRIQFLSAKQGWIWGESSEFFPSGMFSSDNSGKLWSPVTGTVASTWLAGTMRSPESGVMAGPGGTTAIVTNRLLHPLSINSLGNRAIRSLRFSNEGIGWAVADGGVILRSLSGGTSWEVLSTGLPDQLGDIFDWRGVHAIARTVWVVGRPGSVLLCSEDAGRTWQTYATDQPIPLQAVWFHDRQRGWAVGSLGTILATRDGGQSWQVQRRGGERAALLTVHGSESHAPLLAHVQLGAEQGYLATDLSMVGSRTDGTTDAASRREYRLHDSVRIAGGAMAECEWRFPSSVLEATVPQVLERWNREHEGRGLQDLERRLVVAIRTWRPEVIVTGSTNPTEVPEPAAALVSQAMERAFQSAADRTAFPELIQVADLQPWTAKRLFVAVPQSADHDLSIDGFELSHRGTWAGRALDDQANLAKSLLAESYQVSAPALFLRTSASRLAPSKDQNSLMNGIVLEPGGPARRRLAQPVEISDAQRRAVQTRRNLLAIIGRAEAQPILARQLNAQVGGLLGELSQDQAGNMLHDLARVHFLQGRWAETREVLEKLLADYPTHLTSAESHKWLIAYQASSEARHRDQLASTVVQSRVEPASGGLVNNPAEAEGAVTGAAPVTARLSSLRQGGAVGGIASEVQWARGAVEAAKRLVQLSPLVWAEPGVQFPVAAAQRQLGNVKDAYRFYTTFAAGREAGPWADAARSERWIRDRQGVPPKPVIMSMRSPAPPRLDGNLDDPIWKASSAVPLNILDRSEPDNWDTQIRVAHDQRFLYVAIACRKSSGEAVDPVRPRSHDMDLSNHDHVDLYLDLDRDYCTYYHLAVDERGGVFEDCWGDPTWNPTWYVASRSDEQGYRIEMAIPWTELTDAVPAEGTVWAFNAVRVVPGKRIMAWSRPAGPTPRPEGLGYLLFSDGPTANPARSAVAN